VDRSRVQWVAGILLSDPSGVRSTTPEAISFLLHAYVDHGVDTARERVETGLTSALDTVERERDPYRRLACLELLVEAAALTEDPHVVEGSVQRLLPAAVDDLESLVRRSYEPGEGLLGETCAGHLRCANALLSAFQLCGRLPYAMLAEELVLAARRWWQPTSSSFSDPVAPDAADAFYVNCLGAEALCRLAMLHTDPEYRSAAVIAPHAAYIDDAKALLSLLSGHVDEHPSHAAPFGRALLAWFALQRNLQ
jgi:hypothetical protein